MLTTPIDAALPLVIAVVLVCAWVARGTRWAAAVQCAVPLLIAIMVAIANERMRLLAYGVVVTAAFAMALAERRRPAAWLGGVPPPNVVLAVAAIILLRWIPFRDVHIIKELIILAGSVTLFFAIRRPEPVDPAGGTPAFLAVLAVAVVTPIPPGKMALLPFVVALLAFATRRVPQLAIAAVFLLCAFFARYSLATLYLAIAIVFLVPLIERVKPLAYATAFVVFALWPWSGIIARALPLLRNYDPAAGETRSVAQALLPSEALPIAVGPHVRHAVVTTSGAQMARLRPGRIVGTIDAFDIRGGHMTRPIRIGDVADFGFMRREQFFASRNPMPRFSPAEIRDYGANAWVWGAGRTAIATTADMASLRVVAAPDLPPQAHLQIDSVEFPTR